jgi:transcriptional regulator with XRE-family HTH domain
MTIPEQIKAARIARKLSQVELAGKIGTTKQYIYGIEAGKTLSIAQLEKICSILNFDLRIKLVKR